MLGFILSFLSLSFAATAIFGFRQKMPLLGPDGAAIVFALCGLINRNLLIGTYGIDVWIYGLITLFILFALRELCGWLMRRFALHWCSLQRLADRCAGAHTALLLMSAWIAFLAVMLFWLIYNARQHPITICCVLFCEILALCCLYKYGTDLQHLRQQLEHFREGLPITVRPGSFSKTEALLLEIRNRHQEAVRTAVISERFKVDLISNVSHDLRTPLTSILGYSELLQSEPMSEKGREQLLKLHQKAGYMNELVESLFELTKVSSGAVETKQEQLDILRLLEQTIGLFDDQLHAAGLIVRRQYPADTLSLISDGARLHQVFANLLGNAIKYALPGTRIYLEVKVTDSAYRIRMINTASYEMDFSPEEITQRFARGDKARSTKGSGLGLAIAQTYTESVGGKFQVAIDGDQFSAIVELPKTERDL